MLLTKTARAPSSTRSAFPSASLQVAVTGGTHGDELTGAYLARLFQARPELLERPGLTVRALIANEAALGRCRRYLERDLNRCFALDDLEDPERACHEDLLAKELNAQLGPKGPHTKTDVLLDVHSAASEMGLNLNVTGEDPFLLRLAALAVSRMLLAPHHLTVRCYQFPAPDGDAPYLPTIARHGLGIEVGPVPPGSLNGTVFQETRLLVGTLLDLLAEYTAGTWPDTPLPLLVHEQVGTVPYPRAADGSLAAMVHPQRMDRVFTPIHHGEPLFLTFDGEPLPYTPEHGEDGLLTSFVAEPAYMDVNVACCLVRVREREV